MFSVSVSNREPIYTQLEKNIIRYINLGVYEKNSMLPSVRALACELGINPNTVSKAYKNLEANGVVYTVAGKGVFVKGDSMLTNIHKMAADEIKNVLKDAKNSGVEKTEVISIINEVWDGDRND
ncbi:MAG: GntR family transcriptional regulator [Eubacterium sp.]|jgi:GntR family transcriptional regulator|nr:GntR family transcriptional regulator [Eubacterium sp.]